MTHWLTRYDNEDGEPFGELCDCAFAEDHDEDGESNGLLPSQPHPAQEAEPVKIEFNPALLDETL